VTDIIKRRGPGQGPVLTDFPAGDSAPNYVGVLVDELLAIAHGRQALHIIPMHAEARRLLKDPAHNIIGLLSERLGRRPTLCRIRLPFPKDPGCEEKIGAWLKALNVDDRPTDKSAKAWGYAATGTLKKARQVLGKKPRGFWREPWTQALLRSEAGADEAAHRIVDRLKPGIAGEDLPFVLDLTRADVVWYRNYFSILQRDDEATVRRYLKTYAAMK
jgi:hypothetical protein